MKTIVIACTWLLAVGLSWAGSTTTLLAQSTNAVPELLRQLGADDCVTRDRAEAQLRALGASVVPLLPPHADSSDPEVRLRVQRLLAAIPPDLRAFLDRKPRGTGVASEGESVWPCILQITESPPGTNTFRGTIEWTNLNALHAIEGQLATNQLVFRETKIIRRGDAIIGSVYTFPLAGNTDGRLTGPAELDLAKPE